MSYKNTLTANADMLTKAEQMYQMDQRNLALAEGQDIDQIKNNENLKAITNKLNMLREEKAKAMDDKINQYQQHTQVHSSMQGNDNKTNMVMTKQNKEFEFNQQQIDDMKGNIMTVRRQVEISMDETLRRNNILFILKMIFVYLLVSIIPIMLIKNNNIDQTKGLIALGALTGIFVLVILT